MIDGSGTVSEASCNTSRSDYSISRTIAVIGDDIPDEIAVLDGDEEIGRLDEI